VCKAPFNPFSTRVQIWLSKHDANYKPLYVDNQENLGECDLWARPTASNISLDRDLVPEQQVGVPTPNFLDTHFTDVQGDTPLDPVTGQFSLFTHAETTHAVASITVPGVTPEVTFTEQPAHASTSNQSSVLADYSDVIVGPSPANIDLLALDTEAPVGPELLDLVDAMEAELPDLPLIEVGAGDDHVQIATQLNINPHHNMFSPLVGSDDTSVISIDNDDLPSLVSDPGDLQIPFFDMFALKDITNSNEWM
jgi:hypothetical protein